MPPKRKGKSLQSSQAPARKGTRLTTASAPIFASAKPEVAAPALPAAKTTVKRGPTTKSTPVVQIPPLTKDTRAGASSSPPRPDIYDVPSESSEDELQKPAAAPKAPTNGRSNQATINGKVPSRRSRAKAVTVGSEMDELASGDSPAVSKKTPTTRRTIQEKDEPASGVSPAVGKKTLATRRVKETEQGATPKTAVQDAKPPRTRNKGTSMRPRTKMQGKMGVGVPAGGEETTPSANRGGRRKSSAREVGKEEEEDGEGEGEGEDGANAERDKADPDENVMSEQVPPAKLSTTKKKPSIGRPSLGTQGLEDPFAVPSDAIEVDGALEVEEDVPAVTTIEETPAPKKRIPKKPTPKASVTEPKKHGNDIEVTAEAVAVLQKHILSKFMGRQRLNLVGVDDEYSNIHHLLEQTVTAGEGNSMLIIGARGSGKTALVETAISSLSSSHSGEFHVVRLNGLLQTDDKLALREIWRQLGVEMELDENDQPKNANFADTLQSVLAILSHPDELQPNDEEPDANGDPDPSRTTTAVIFVLDEFDHFALHPRQTLLYNLFDIAQAKKAPIAMLGLTCKVSVIDSLEKRVKSRFSHRKVHLKLPATVESFWEMVKEGLSADTGSDVALGDVNMERYFEAWNQCLDELRQVLPFASLLRRTFASSKTCAPIFNAFILPLSSLSPSSPFPPATTLAPLSPPQSNLHLLQSLSDLQLALLISAARLEVLADTETVNFEMVYDEYLKLCTKNRVQNTPSEGVGRVWSKSVAVGAWEGLERMGLVVADTGGRRGMWRVDVGLMEVREDVKGTQWVKWCKEVI